jgi:hypothetical protein
MAGQGPPPRLLLEYRRNLVGQLHQLLAGGSVTLALGRDPKQLDDNSFQAFTSARRQPIAEVAFISHIFSTVSLAQT